MNIEDKIAEYKRRLEAFKADCEKLGVDVKIEASFGEFVSTVEEIRRLKKAVRALAALLDGVAWRTVSKEERSSHYIKEQIDRIMEGRK